MKLRNKKSGKITGLIWWECDEGCFVVDRDCYYNSLTELNNDWEDYEEPEPLIKDEKIRKAVRAWAEALDIDRVFYDAKMVRFYDRKSKFIIGIGYPIVGIWDRKEGYTIAELCGEEE